MTEASANSGGRRAEDSEELPIVMSYRLGHLEKAMQTWEAKFDEKLDLFDQKIDDLIFEKGQTQLLDYRVKELEKWKTRMFAMMTTLSAGMILLLLQEILRRMSSGS